MNIAYTYHFSSSLELVENSRRLTLATCGGAELHPYFFHGRLLRPRITCDSLLALSEVSRTRFYSPTALRERLLAAADPVVTSGGERLRFEAFSVCGGVYARLDLLPESVDGHWVSKGTTNVDFNSPMRGALAQVLESDLVGLNVGVDGVKLEHAGKAVEEKKVKLPVSWLKGFVEVQAYQAKMKPAFEVRASDLHHVISDIANQKIWHHGELSYLVQSGQSVRFSQRPGTSGIAVGDPRRLKILTNILRHSRNVRFYATTDGAMAVEVQMPDSRFFIVLSPNASRGFSGEGQALNDLVDCPKTEELSKVKAELQWQAKISPQVLSKKLDLDIDTIYRALSALGSRGLVGYDLSDGSYFHRELPFDLALVEELHPRLRKARKLVNNQGVSVTEHKSGLVKGFVHGSDGEHLVTITEGNGKCTCTWFSKHSNERGPCSHILALELFYRSDRS